MDLFSEILAALQQEERVMLATIISTTGSTPASAFSRMLVKEGGIISLGTVGGGCMEGDVLLHAGRLLRENKAEILRFHLNEDDVEHGLICGGGLDVLIEPLSREKIPLFEELKSIRDNGDDCVLATHLAADGFIRSKSVIAGDEKTLIERSKAAQEVLAWASASGRGPAGTEAPMKEAVIDSILRAQRRNETVLLKLRDGDVILEPVAGAPGLVLFGGGHVSKYISRGAAMAGFRVTVVDDRDKFANRERFPEAVQTVAEDFIEAFNHITVKPSTYVVIVTRGHRHDEEVLERIAGTSARYIGMIGSRKKVLAAFEHLAEKGIPAERLRRVHAPMGIDIGAATAEEIGISVVAELIAERRGAKGPFHHKSDSMDDPVKGRAKRRPAASAKRGRA